ncbi:phage antirepressor N-terminal domain-containing protein [Morganella psychrotolerans]|nr:phage antirepressor N-terminal domain-containing protein [Morganella psychrotolerans]
MQYPAIAEIMFKGDTLTTIQDGSTELVAMKPIVEAIGLDWKSQHRKLMSQKDKFSCGHMTIPSAGGLQEMLCMPLRKLNGWLFSINPNKVKASIRNKLISYQEECFSALHDYWSKGAAVNSRKVSVMEQLNEACADYKRDEAIASKFGKGLNEWKWVKPAHNKKMRELANQAGGLLLDLILVEIGKGKITRS